MTGAGLGPGFWPGWLIASAAVVYAGFAAMLAAIASCGWMRGRHSDWARVTRARAESILKAATGATLLMVAIQLVLQTALMADADAAPDTAEPFWRSLVSMATATHFGRGWCAGMVALMVVAAVAGSGRFAAGGRIALVLTWAGSAAFAVARSVVSHAGAEGDWSLAVAVLCIHLLLVCLWLGSVTIGAFSVFSTPVRSALDRRDAQAWVAALSNTAGWALLGIGLSGLYNLWRVGAASTPLLGSGYGTVLTVKLGLVLVAVGLGAFNRFIRLPAVLDSGDGTGPAEVIAWAGVIRILRIEALVLMLALAASAILGSTEPPDPTGGTPTVDIQRGTASRIRVASLS